VGDHVFQTLRDQGGVDAVSRNLLLGGPPGTGKTHAAVRAAQNLGINYAVVKVSDIESKWVGGSGRSSTGDVRAHIEHDEATAVPAVGKRYRFLAQVICTPPWEDMRFKHALPW
jgi:DNA polymerase III delta prime subunit